MNNPEHPVKIELCPNSKSGINANTYRIVKLVGTVLVTDNDGVTKYRVGDHVNEIVAQDWCRHYNVTIRL